jgi:hypothetical protein
MCVCENVLQDKCCLVVIENEGYLIRASIDRLRCFCVIVDPSNHSIVCGMMCASEKVFDLCLIRHFVSYEVAHSVCPIGSFIRCTSLTFIIDWMFPIQYLL